MKRSLSLLFKYIASACLLLLLSNVSFATSKIDTIYFQDGDRITGEVKSLDHNMLNLSTDDSGTIHIEWSKIDSVHIKNPMRIILSDGHIMFGILKPSGKVGSCIIEEEAGTKDTIRLWSIVELTPLEKRFIDRVSGTVSSGYSYVKASDVTKLDFAGNLKYRGEKVIIQVDYNVVLTKESIGTTQRQSGGASLYRVLPKNWSIHGAALAESNTYFELDLRTSVALGPTYFLIRNNKQDLSAGLGITANTEYSGELVRDNFEGLIQFNYMLFLFDSPEVSINVKANLIPGISEPGRFRNEIDANIKWEAFHDFFLKFTYYNSFDNEPLSGINAGHDWGNTIGLEYKF
ncbi:DUF481 domain-containing protein [Carboxylicivirga sp. RSCT41]|uniref:DUF481 domain-containing protein n=1 Tax=Carboxylicivirga agarovorans TaxID=3417570 RepID=UPI003D356CAE